MRARSRLGGAPAFLFALALLAVVAGSASLAHTHQSATPAFFNEDHELSALAALGGSAGVVVTTACAAPCFLVVPLAARPTSEAALARPVRSSDFRAPPAV